MHRVWYELRHVAQVSAAFFGAFVLPSCVQVLDFVAGVVCLRCYSLGGAHGGWDLVAFRLAGLCTLWFLLPLGVRANRFQAAAPEMDLERRCQDQVPNVALQGVVVSSMSFR